MDQEIPADEPGRKPRRPSGWRIVVAVLVVLSAAVVVLLPLRSDYTVRAQVSEGVALADDAKTAIATFYEKHQAFPLDNSEAGIAQARSITGFYVVSLTVARGNVVAVYGNRSDATIAGKRLVFMPHPAGSTLAWTCDSAAGTTIAIKDRPALCR